MHTNRVVHNEVGSSETSTALPPYLYLPCAQHVSDPAEAVVEYRHLSDGRVALLAYTALDRLHTCCGEAQPWVVVPALVLPQLRRARPWDSLLLDVPVPEEQRRTPHSEIHR